MRCCDKVELGVYYKEKECRTRTHQDHQNFLAF